MTVRVLVADDDAAARNLLAEVLAREGYEVVAATGGEAALALAQDTAFDVALLDVRMPDRDGLEVLRALKPVSPDTIVIMMTAFGSVDSAIRAIKEGAYDYVSKPFKVEEIKVTIQRALERRRLIAENLRFRQALKEKYRIENIVGSSEPMLEVSKLVARVAPTRSAVLIQGETGTGKELIARAIHYMSPRADRPFVVIDSGALAESLVESELFGHVRGAFTGALGSKRGLFEEAEGGTCFLDEVGEITPAVQGKLLRVLQEREVKRVGGTESVKLDVRVIAATNRDLEGLVAAGRFREDLYYRLSVVTILLPPLRERPEDIPLLATHFLRRYAAENDKSISHLAPETMARLVSYDWPGNVRELQHVIERAVALTANPVLLLEDLPAKLRGGPGASSPASRPSGATLREAIRQRIEQVLQETRGNRSQAAERLGVPRRTLYRLAKRYGIPFGDRE